MNPKKTNFAKKTKKNKKLPNLYVFKSDLKAEAMEAYKTLEGVKSQGDTENEEIIEYVPVRIAKVRTVTEFEDI